MANDKSGMDGGKRSSARELFRFDAYNEEAARDIPCQVKASTPSTVISADVTRNFHNFPV